MTPPANVPEAPLAPLLLVAGALVALYVYMRRRRRDGGGDPPE